MTALKYTPSLDCVDTNRSLRTNGAFFEEQTCNFVNLNLGEVEVHEFLGDLVIKVGKFWSDFN